MVSILHCRRQKACESPTKISFALSCIYLAATCRHSAWHDRAGRVYPLFVFFSISCPLCMICNAYQFCCSYMLFQMSNVCHAPRLEETYSILIHMLASFMRFGVVPCTCVPWLFLIFGRCFVARIAVLVGSEAISVRMICYNIIVSLPLRT